MMMFPPLTLSTSTHLPDATRPKDRSRRMTSRRRGRCAIGPWIPPAAIRLPSLRPPRPAHGRPVVVLDVSRRPKWNRLAQCCHDAERSITWEGAKMVHSGCNWDTIEAYADAARGAAIDLPSRLSVR